MVIKLKLLLKWALPFIAILFFLTMRTWAADYYVDVDCATPGNGTTSSCDNDANDPFQTIANVNAATFSAGDNIYFQATDTWTQAATLTLDQSGTTGNPITYGKFGAGADPIITNSNNVTAIETDGSYITIQDIQIINTTEIGIILDDAGDSSTPQRNIIMQRLTIDNNGSGCAISNGQNAVNHIQVLDSTITNTALGGICFQGGSHANDIHDTIISGNVIHDVSDDAVLIHKGTSNPITCAGSRHYIYNNLLYEAGENPIDLECGSYIVVSGNTTYNTTSTFNADITIGGVTHPPYVGFLRVVNHTFAASHSNIKEVSFAASDHTEHMENFQLLQSRSYGEGNRAQLSDGTAGPDFDRIYIFHNVFDLVDRSVVNQSSWELDADNTNTNVKNNIFVKDEGDHYGLNIDGVQAAWDVDGNQPQ